MPNKLMACFPLPACLNPRSDSPPETTEGQSTGPSVAQAAAAPPSQPKVHSFSDGVDCRIWDENIPQCDHSYRGKVKIVQVIGIVLVGHRDEWTYDACDSYSQCDGGQELEHTIAFSSIQYVARTGINELEC